MKLSRREGIMALVTSSVILFGITAMGIKPGLDRWKDLREEQAKIRALIDRDRAVVAERETWRGQMELLNKEVPPFPADKKMDIHWLSVMDTVASQRGVTISKRQVGEEKKIGNLYELPIECKECEGTLEAIVRFLFELERQGAMLDIRQLSLKPKSAAVLRGRFALYCAYTREEDSK